MGVMRAKSENIYNFVTITPVTKGNAKNTRFLKQRALFSALITRYGAKFPDSFPLWGKLQIAMGHFCLIPPLRTGIAIKYFKTCEYELLTPSELGDRPNSFFELGNFFCKLDIPRQSSYKENGSGR